MKDGYMGDILLFTHENDITTEWCLYWFCIEGKKLC